MSASWSCSATASNHALNVAPSWEHTSQRRRTIGEIGSLRNRFRSRLMSCFLTRQGPLPCYIAQANSSEPASTCESSARKPTTLQLTRHGSQLLSYRARMCKVSWSSKITTKMVQLHLQVHSTPRGAGPPQRWEGSSAFLHLGVWQQP